MNAGEDKTVVVKQDRNIKYSRDDLAKCSGSPPHHPIPSKMFVNSPMIRKCTEELICDLCLLDKRSKRDAPTRSI